MLNPFTRSAFCLLAATLFAAPLHATLNPGDIAITGVNMEGGSDQIAFVALKPIPYGETIRFTDNGWNPITNSLGTSESTLLWTANTYIHPGQQVIVPLGFDLSTFGDQVLAYQGSPTQPSFIDAVSINFANVWTTNVYNESSSGLPPGLVDGFTALRLTIMSNWHYNCNFLDGVKAELLKQIHCKDNWQGRNSGTWNLGNCSFQLWGGQPSFAIGKVEDVPENADTIWVPVYCDAIGPYTVQVIPGNTAATWGTGGDIQFAGSSTLSFSQGNLAYLPLRIIDDNTCEGDEDVCLGLTNPSMGNASAVAAIFNILGNDGSVTTIQQTFEGSATDTWTYTSSPNAYNSQPGFDPLTIVGAQQVWAIVKEFAGAFGSASGQKMWGFSGFNSNSPHNLDFATLNLAGFDHSTLSFDYITYNFGWQDQIECWVAYDNSSNWNSAQVTPLNTNTQQWTHVQVEVPAGVQHLRLRLRVKQLNGIVCGGFDNVNWSGTSCQQPTSISLGNIPSSICTGNGNALNVPFSSTGYFNPANHFQVELSNAAGSFAQPIAIGNIAASGNAPQGTIPCVLPSLLLPGNAYRIRIRSTQPAFTSPDNGFNISISGTGVQLTASLQPNGFHVSCPGANDGAIQSTVTQGQAPYLYTWTGPNGFSSSTPNISQLGPGTYNLTLTDANGCQAIASTVLSSPEISIALTSLDVSCFGANDGMISVSLGGTNAPFTHSWTGPNGFSSGSPTITGLAPGTYTLTATDQGGCSLQQVVAISEPALLTLSAIVPQYACGYEISCHGAADAAIDIGINGGNGAFQYQWSGPAGFQSTLQDLTQLGPGAYQLSVTDSRGCTAAFDTLLDEPAALAATLSSPLNACGFNISCGGMSDGSIQTSPVTGGCAPYTYLWSANAGAAQTPNLSNLAAGNYSLTITDANNCTLVIGTTLTEPDPLQLAATLTDATCNASQDGAIDLTVNGGCGSYTYAWTGANGFSSNAQDIQNLGVGTYYVTVTDSLACTTSDSFTVGAWNGLLATLGCCQDTMICPGDSVSLRVDILGHGPWQLTYDLGTIPVTVIVYNSPYFIHLAPELTTHLKLSQLMQYQTPCRGTVCGSATIVVTPCDSSACEDLCVNTGLVASTQSAMCTTVTLEVACDTLCNNKGPIKSPESCMMLRTLNFNRLPNGQALPAGSIIQNQWSSLGITFSADNAMTGHPDSAITFNSAIPTSGEEDLGTPHQDFAGPGIGTGGAAGQAGENAQALGNLLIIAENLTDNDFNLLVDTPVDEAAGGTLGIHFASPTFVESVRLVDLDHGQVVVEVVRAAGPPVNIPAPQWGDNAVADVLIRLDSVVEVRIHFPGDGALAGVSYCPVGIQPSFIDISIPCGILGTFSNSAGLPMQPITDDLTTGITGLRIEGLPAYCLDTAGLPPFTIEYTVCATVCPDSFCLPLIAYGRDGCIQYEMAQNGPVSTPARPAPAPQGTTLRLSPNPVSSMATMSFTLAEAGKARVDLVDLAGRPIRTLWEGESQAEQTNNVFMRVDGLANGIYIVRLQTARSSRALKMIVAQ